MHTIIVNTTHYREDTKWGMWHGRWLYMEHYTWLDEHAPDIAMGDWDVKPLVPKNSYDLAKFEFQFRDPDIAALFKLTFGGSDDS